MNNQLCQIQYEIFFFENTLHNKKIGMYLYFDHNRQNQQKNLKY